MRLSADREAHGTGTRHAARQVRPLTSNRHSPRPAYAEPRRSDALSVVSSAAASRKTSPEKRAQPEFRQTGALHVRRLRRTVRKGRSGPEHEPGMRDDRLQLRSDAGRPPTRVGLESGFARRRVRSQAHARPIQHASASECVQQRSVGYRSPFERQSSSLSLRCARSSCAVAAQERA